MRTRPGSVRVVGAGRTGSIITQRGRARGALLMEFGGGEVVAIIDVPSPACGMADTLGGGP